MSRETGNDSSLSRKKKRESKANGGHRAIRSPIPNRMTDATIVKYRTRGFLGGGKEGPLELPNGAPVRSRNLQNDRVEHDEDRISKMNPSAEGFTMTSCGNFQRNDPRKLDKTRFLAVP